MRAASFFFRESVDRASKPSLVLHARPPAFTLTLLQRWTQTSREPSRAAPYSSLQLAIYCHLSISAIFESSCRYPWTHSAQDSAPSPREVCVCARERETGSISTLLPIPSPSNIVISLSICHLPSALSCPVRIFPLRTQLVPAPSCDRCPPAEALEDVVARPGGSVTLGGHHCNLKPLFLFLARNRRVRLFCCPDKPLVAS